MITALSAFLLITFAPVEPGLPDNTHGSGVRACPAEVCPDIDWGVVELYTEGVL